MPKLLTVGFVVATALVIARPARAANITAVNLYGENVTFGNDAFSQQNGFAGQSGLAGEILLTTNNGSTVDAWCMDLFHDVYIGQNQDLTYTGVTLTGASTGNGGTLTPMQAQEVGNLVEYGDRIVAAGGDVNQAAGVQMAIWATEYAGLTFAGPSAAVADEQADLAYVPQAGVVESLVSLTGTQTLAADANQIPEPATLGMMATAILALAFLRTAMRARPAGAAAV